MTIRNFKVQAPGRVFLFGEHSDYLGLEVISMALNRSIEITVEPRNDNLFSIKYLDISDSDSFSLDERIDYRHKRDYLRSCFNVIKNAGAKPLTGANLTVKGEIPISAGLSSSSALSVASVLAFSNLAGKHYTKDEIVKFAFEGEVVEFGESGGMMDHYSSTYGGIIHVDFGEKISLTEIPVKLDGIIIGDSQQKKKDTVGDLRMIRNTVESGYKELSKIIPSFSHRITSLKEIEEQIDNIPSELRLMTLSTIRNRNLTRRALSYLKTGNLEPVIIGELIEEEHRILRDGFKRSTDRIESIIAAAKNAGALGCKINGSGKGGTILAYAPGNETKVVKAIEDAGGKPYEIKTGNGASINFQ
ncbi:MAG: mevalonate kinase [Candidatus Thorarchaeota archaeon]